MPKPHQKHPSLKRPTYGEFHRHEYAIIGTPCGEIQHLAKAIINSLSADYKVGYVDADHASADEEDAVKELPLGHLEYTDKINFHRFDRKGTLEKFQYRQQFYNADLVLINGNHFRGKRQIVVVDPRKEKSLAKKLDRLTDVAMILLQTGVSELPDYLKTHLPHHQEIPTRAITDIDWMTNFIKKEQEAARPPLHGLVLAGGKSQRMGEDKGALDYHGKPQREYAADLLAQYCAETYISIREKQTIESTYPTLVDTFTGLGPFGAIASAFRQNPEAAWLVVACDLPLLDKKTVANLVEQRDISKVATAFHNSATNFPEPLITIWEPRSYPELLQFLAQGYACPRKVLINTEIKEIQLEDEKVLRNVNTAVEREEVLDVLQTNFGSS